MDKILNNLRNHAGKWIACMGASLALIWGATTYIGAVADEAKKDAIKEIKLEYNGNIENIDEDLDELKDSDKILLEKIEMQGKDISEILGYLRAQAEASKNNE